MRTILTDIFSSKDGKIEKTYCVVCPIPQDEGLSVCKALEKLLVCELCSVDNRNVAGTGLYQNVVIFCFPASEPKKMSPNFDRA